MADDSRTRRRRQKALVQRPWQAALGVTAGVSKWNLSAFLLHAASSIVFLVFLNATQPFLIAQLSSGEAGKQRQGALSGTLVFYDELLSLFLVLVWGSLADVVGTKPVAVAGYIFISMALYPYTLAEKPWPDLLLSRLLFAVGGSAATSMLTGILNSYSATFQEVQSRRAREQEDDGAGQESAPCPDELTETDPLLLPSLRLPRRHPVHGRRQTHGRLAALTGLTTGCGALFAVFVLLRLPAQLAGAHDERLHAPSRHPKQDEAIRKGTTEAFYIVTALALLVAIILSVGLKLDAPSAVTQSMARQEEAEVTVSSNTREARRRRLKARVNRNDRGDATTTPAQARVLGGMVRLARGTLFGFILAKRDATLPLAYIGGALARASTIATTVFIPLLVTRFFYTSGRCSALPTPDLPPDELKRQCREAFTVASILSGVIQLVALLLAPLIGYLCDARSPAQTLLLTSSVGLVSYLAIGLMLPHDGDPRGPVAWVSAVGIGFAQIGAIVSSLALCAKAKARLAEVEASERPASSEETRQANPFTPVSGAIAGAYSATGGLSILVVSKLGGWLSDKYASAAFLLMAALSFFTVVASTAVVFKERT